MQKIFIAGHNGMVGRAIHSQLFIDSNNKIITASKAELNLKNQHEVKVFFEKNNFDQVYLAAAKVGGIHANNTFPAEFIYDNLMIQNNIIHQSFKSGVKKLLFLGSSCIYPRNSSQPISEDSLLSGYLEPTNEPYAIAKIAGIKLCESYNRQYGTDFRSIMPTNLYGPGDNFHEENSHVIPALMKRFHDAKVSSKENVLVWGDGSALREFLYVGDMAKASIFVMNMQSSLYRKETKPMLSHYNIGIGKDYSIKSLAHMIANVVGFNGNISWDTSKPNGTPKKLMDSSKIFQSGWLPEHDLKNGLELTYDWFLENQSSLRS
jgi:GDP-L-fucose synthase